MKKLIIITDLDGTLLDASTFSFEAANDALTRIREQQIPLIICSSKTQTEIEHYRLLLNNRDPFISENGGGVFMPADREDLMGHVPQGIMEWKSNYLLIPLGAKYAELRKGVSTLRDMGFHVRGFGDMEANEIAGLTGLPLKEAAMAKERDFDEPFLFDGPERDIPNLLLAAKDLGFNVTRGRFYHLLGNSDKGKAVSLLLDLYKRKFGDVHSVALGDSPNDLPMLENVDTPVVVQKPNGTYDTALDIHRVIRADGIGPKGWRGAVMRVLSDIVDP